MLAVSRFVLRHKLAVALFWLAVLAAGAVASAKLSGRLSPGRKAARATGLAQPMLSAAAPAGTPSSSARS